MIKSAARESPGLRERKKARTRAAIQEQALRLFGEHGFHATTMEQVAAAAEVSPSTLYRYFATKEELVRFNALDHPIAQAFDDQPADLGPVPALRSALRQALGDLDDTDLALSLQRERLIMEMGHHLAGVVSGIDMFTEMFTQRPAPGQTEQDVRLLAGAVFGVLAVIWLDWADHPDQDIRQIIDDGLARLER